MSATPISLSEPRKNSDSTHENLSDLLRKKIEKLQTARFATRFVTFIITALLIIFQSQGPEAALILVPELVAFMIYRKVRPLHIAHRRVRIAALFKDGLGSDVDKELAMEIADDFPTLRTKKPGLTLVPGYYSSKHPSGINRLLENMHESVFYWSAVLRNQRVVAARWMIFGMGILILAALVGTYQPVHASKIMLVAILILAAIFVTEKVNESVDIGLFQKEFTRLEKEFHLLRQEFSIEQPLVIWIAGRYVALSQSAPIVPARDFELTKVKIAEDWNHRNDSSRPESNSSR